MDWEIAAMTPEERLYAYSQSAQIAGQTGCIGYLRGDFDNGQEFYSSWFDHRSEYKTDEFKAEFDKVVNTLREKDGLLCTRDSMTRFCCQNPEAGFPGNVGTEYGFQLKTCQHTYMLRCSPISEDYNFHLYAYVARFLEHHMEQAKQGVRFITPGYKELFRIPDGGKIRIQMPDGREFDQVCRYVDGSHLEVGNSLYHICQFAELIERNAGIVQPLQDIADPSRDGKNYAAHRKQRARDGR